MTFVVCTMFFSTRSARHGSCLALEDSCKGPPGICPSPAVFELATAPTIVPVNDQP